MPSAAAATAPGTITTVAGGPGRGVATTVFQQPTGVAAGPGGALYVADNSGVIREFSSASTYESVTAGVGVPGFSGDGGPAVRAKLGATPWVAVDSHGNEVITDTYSSRIRVAAATSGTFYGQAMKAGDIYSVAGNGTQGYSGDGGPATSAALDFPEGATVDAAGNLITGDTANRVVRVVAAMSGTFYGLAMKAGDIYTVAGNGTFGYSGDGGPATSAEMEDPGPPTVDASGNLIIPDSGLNSSVVRVVAATSGTFYGLAMKAGDIYTVAGDGTYGYSGDGGPAADAELEFPYGTAVDPAGNLLIADFGAGRVRVVAATSGMFYGQAMKAGDIYTIAGGGTSGSGAPATSAALAPIALTFDGAGNLVIADEDYDRIWVVAKAPGTFYGQAMTAGDIYAVAGNGPTGSSGNGGPALNAEFAPAYRGSVAGVTVDAGNYVITQGVRMWFICETPGTYFGRAMVRGDAYTVAGNGKVGAAGDGGPATSVQLNAPQGVAVDRAGNLVVAASGSNQIRVVADTSGTFYGRAMKAGDIYTVAGQRKGGFSGDGGPATSAELNGPEGVAVDGTGNLVIADTGNTRVRVVAAKSGPFYGHAMKAGDIYTVAGDGTFGYSGNGGPATSAELDAPAGVAVGAAGNLVIADTGNNRVRVVAAAAGTFYGHPMKAGDIYTVAGDSHEGFSGDGGPATSAGLNKPHAVAVDSAGNLVIADTADNRIRVVAATSGTFDGQAMKAGDIYTVAGRRTPGFSGDGGPATSAELNYPEGVAVSGTGNLIIADSRNGRVRLVTG